VFKKRLAAANFGDLVSTNIVNISGVKVRISSIIATATAYVKGSRL